MFALQVILNALVGSTQVLILASGFYLIYMVARIHHVAIAAAMVSGAYVSYSLLQADFPLWGALVLGCLFAGTFNGLMYFFLRSFVLKKQDLLALIASLAMMVGTESVLTMIYGSQGRFLSPSVLPVYKFGELQLTQVGVWTLGVGVILMLVSAFVIYSMPIGRTLRAVQQHAACATLVGIKERRVQFWVFFVSGAMAALVGVLTAMNTTLVPTSGMTPIVMAFVAVLVGGSTDYRGTVVASFLIVLIPELLISLNVGGLELGSSWKMLLVFILAVALLLWRPNGLFIRKARRA